MPTRSPCPRWMLLPLLITAGCAHAPPPQSVTSNRLISLTPSLTEILFDLGAGSRVVAVTRNDDYPAQVKLLPKVGDMSLDYEAMVADKPDLVLLDPALNRDQAARLRQLGLRVAEVDSQSLEAVPTAVLKVASLTGTDPRGAQLVASFNAFLREARTRNAARKTHPRVFAEIAEQPLMSAGGGTYVDDLLTLAGGTNVCGDQHGYPSVSLERLLALQPDVVVLTCQSVDEVRSKPGWSSLEAVRRGRVYRIDEDLLVRPTLRAREAVETMRAWFGG